MAVTQFFIVSFDAEAVKVDLVEETMTLSRSAAESLYHDLGEALGTGAVTGPQGGIQEALASLLGQGIVLPDNGASYEAPTGRMMSPDEALARVQAQATLAETTAPVRNSGTGIGNG